MSANFEFLQGKSEYKLFSAACIEAEKVLATSPAMAAIGSRRALELAIKWVYSADNTMKMPYKDNLQALIHEPTFRFAVSKQTWGKLPYIIKLGNLSVHTGRSINRSDAVLSLSALFEFIQWIDYCYGTDYKEGKFNEANIPAEKVTLDEAKIKKMDSLIEQKDSKIEALRAKVASISAKLTEERDTNKEERRFTPIDITEFATRKKYIDLDLKLLGWVFGDEGDVGEEVELFGMPNPQGKGFADFVLYGRDGLPLAVIEAKRTSKDPKIGSQQAKLYADCLEKMTGRRPMMYTTNGFETYFWDDVSSPQRKVSSVFSKADLEKLMNRRDERKALAEIPIDDKITDRYYQKEAIRAVCDNMEIGHRKFLLVMATGTGKTVTAVSDAKGFGERTLFLAHTRELVTQAKSTFEDIWPDKQAGMFVAEQKDADAYVVCASIQSVAQNFEQFKPDDFGYIIVDECHHGAANTYKKLLEYFEPKFTLGLTATPERTDGEDLLEIFRNVAHKLDLKTAVEMGELAPVRCIRVKTNVDLSTVRINGIKYYSQDLESKLHVPERNRIIIETYLQYVKNRKTVVFCASVKHAEQISKLFKENGIACEAVSGLLKDSKRAQILDEYENGSINVLCACDLLNEGWDSPRTEVLFMARPTMSKTLYIQQLGRGMRKCAGKEYLMVFDFIDNVSMFNAPYSIHRLLNIKDYRPGQMVLGSERQMEFDRDLYAKGEKPEIWLDLPIDVADYELINLFNWQDEVKDMISQLEFVRMVDVQAETIERYIRDGRLEPDLEVPVGEKRTFKYFREDTVRKYAREFGWDIITAANMKDKFMEMVKTMDMSFSYKPVLLKAMLEHVDDKGRVRVEDIVDYFIDFYSDRKDKGLFVEKKTSVYCKEGFTCKDAERNIFANPFKRFEDMRFMRRCREIEFVEFNRHVFKKLTKEDIAWIKVHCDEKLKEYYGGMNGYNYFV